MKKRILGIVLTVILGAALCGCAGKKEVSKENPEAGDISSDSVEGETVSDGEEQAEAEEKPESEEPTGEPSGLLDVTEEWLINSEEGIFVLAVVDGGNGVPPFTLLLPAKSNNYKIDPYANPTVYFGDEDQPPVFQLELRYEREGYAIFPSGRQYSNAEEVWDYDNGTYVVQAFYSIHEAVFTACLVFGNLPNEGAIIIRAVSNNIPADVLSTWVEENFEHLKKQADALPTDYEPVSQE